MMICLVMGELQTASSTYIFKCIIILSRLVNLVKSQPQEDKPGESLLAGAVAMALCFIAKVSFYINSNT